MIVRLCFTYPPHDLFYGTCLKHIQISNYEYRLLCFDELSRFDEPPSLQNLGLSEICLATLASEGDEKKDVLDTPPKLRSSEVHSQDTVGGEVNYGSNICGEALKMIFVSDDDYESLPSYMKSLAPWKDLLSAVAKMNSFLSKKGNSQQSNFFHPEELESMGLGQKGRSYLLLLVRMNRLVVEIKSGLITYRVL
ncbi:hypothetical protein RND81_04G051200 [Saponaria officinalis]|uniref:Uncharacterized protein n=1 Tax=Saponaria officinalis TaxID=3572 RepID=A0AAW1LL32_SAPOF